MAVRALALLGAMALSAPAAHSNPSAIAISCTPAVASTFFAAAAMVDAARAATDQAQTRKPDLEAASKEYAKDPTYEHGLALAAAELEAGKPQLAKDHLQKCRQQRESAEVYSLLGRAETALSDYRAAAVAYQTAAKMDTSEANIFDYGTALFRLDHSAAITILRYGLQKYPKSVRLRVALGTVLYAEGNPKEGAHLLCDAEDMDPSDPHPLEILADTEIVPSELAERVTAQFAALLRRYPNDGRILFDYTMAKAGLWSFRTDSVPADAVEAIEKAVRLSPDLHQAYFQLSQIAGERRDFAAQIRLLKKAISLAPDRETYHYKLAFAYRNSGDQADFKKEMALFQQLHDANAKAK
jgi:tetratricopeptide (TPR) repeat protein